MDTDISSADRRMQALSDMNDSIQTSLDNCLATGQTDVFLDLVNDLPSNTRSGVFRLLLTSAITANEESGCVLEKVIFAFCNRKLLSKTEIEAEYRVIFSRAEVTASEAALTA